MFFYLNIINFFILYTFCKLKIKYSILAKGKQKEKIILNFEIKKAKKQTNLLLWMLIYLLFYNFSFLMFSLYVVYILQKNSIKNTLSEYHSKNLIHVLTLIKHLQYTAKKHTEYISYSLLWLFTVPIYCQSLIQLS